VCPKVDGKRDGPKKKKLRNDKGVCQCLFQQRAQNDLQVETSTNEDELWQLEFVVLFHSKTHKRAEELCDCEQHSETADSEIQAAMQTMASVCC